MPQASRIRGARPDTGRFFAATRFSVPVFAKSPAKEELPPVQSRHLVGKTIIARPLAAQTSSRVGVHGNTGRSPARGCTAHFGGRFEAERQKGLTHQRNGEIGMLARPERRLEQPVERTVYKGHVERSDRGFKRGPP